MDKPRFHRLLSMKGPEFPARFTNRWVTNDPESLAGFRRRAKSASCRTRTTVIRCVVGEPDENVRRVRR